MEGLTGTYSDFKLRYCSFCGFLFLLVSYTSHFYLKLDSSVCFYMQEMLGNKNQERQDTLKREDFLLGIPQVVIQRKPQALLGFHMTEHSVRTCRDRFLRQHPALLIKMILVFFVDPSLTFDFMQQL